MSLSRLLIAPICLLLLSGQMEYGYDYCVVMKHAVDARMARQCAHRIPDQSGTTGRSAVSRMPLMKIISKASTDTFEQARLPLVSRPVHADLVYPAPYISSLTSRQATIPHVRTLLEDIRLSTGCLRL